MSAWHKEEEAVSRKRRTEREGGEANTETTVTIDGQILGAQEARRGGEPREGVTTAADERRKKGAERAARYLPD